MHIAMQQELFELVEKEIRETGMDTASLPGTGGSQVGNTLRVLLPLTDEAHPAILDIMAATLNEGTDIIQFYATLTLEVGSGREELEKALPGLNFFCPVGSFGIFRRAQLYYKYSMLLRESQSAEQLCADVLDTLAAFYQVLDERYPLAMRLARGEVTFAQAIQGGELMDPSSESAPNS